MKKAFLTTLLMFGSFVFAEQSLEIPNEINAKIISESLSSELPPKNLDIMGAKEGFFYVRFAAAEEDLSHVKAMLPGLGAGYRRISGSHSAADISLAGIGNVHKKKQRFYWVAPRASYLHYFTPNSEGSFYTGLGIGWGGLNVKNKAIFLGLVPSVTIGYDLAPRTNLLSFVELVISQPTISVIQKGGIPAPIAEFSTGIGF